MLRLQSGGRLGACALAFVCAASTASAEAPPEPPKAETSTVSKFAPPKLLHHVEAVYPPDARKQGLEGTVLLQLEVEADGSVSHVAVTHGAGHGFDEAATAAAQQLRFEPATQGGVPVQVQINYEITFALAPIPSFKDIAHASPDAAPTNETTIIAQRPLIAASALTVSDQEFLSRPRTTPEDVLTTVPGLVLVQHQGGGKADQLLLRGFDADHGTDVALSIDDMPINMVSHGHGQGYSDLNFIIPEVIDHIDVEKGPYYADHGDFATAGAANLTTRDVIEKSQVMLEGGSFDSGRFVGILAPQVGNLHPWLAAEFYGTNGPFDHPEGLMRYNVMSKVVGDFTSSIKGSILISAYGSTWEASGLIPVQLVSEGLLSPFGAVDPSQGGQTQRQQLIASLSARTGPDSHLKMTLSVIHYTLALFDNFTLYQRDPVNGDEIEQDDARVTTLADLRYERTVRDWLPGTFVATAGVQVRNDSIDAQLWHVADRARLAECFTIANPCIYTDDNQTDAAAYLQAEWSPVHIVRIVGGLRGDLFEFDLHSLKPGGGLDPEYTSPLPPMVQAGILSPKASVIVSPIPALDLYVNFGSGFHSNDARSVIEMSGNGALPRALGGEVGARTHLLHNRLAFTAALWILHLDSEQVFDADTGGTEPSYATLRYGLEIEGRWEILPWLSADADLSLTHAQYQLPAAEGNAVAYAPPLVLTAGLTAHHPSGVGGSLRLRDVSNRPGNTFSPADGVPECTSSLNASTTAGQDCYLIATGYTVLDAMVGYERPRWGVAVVVTNLTDQQYRDGQVGQIYQLQGADHPVQGMTFTPGTPIAARVQVAVRF